MADSTGREPPRDRDSLKPVYCQNRRCRNQVGRVLLSPGSVVSFPCRHCGIKTVIVGGSPPHWA